MLQSRPDRYEKMSGFRASLGGATRRRDWFFPPSRKDRVMRTALGAVLTLVALTVALYGQTPKPPPPGEQPVKAPGARGPPHRRQCHQAQDLDERLDLVTPYGKLAVPLTAIRCVEFATRVPEEVQSASMPRWRSSAARTSGARSRHR
jgi:hypothetical protein